jgi:putative transposase
VAHPEFDLSELLDALRAGDITDPIRTSLEWVLQQLIEAEASEVIGAAPHERSASRTNQRNGHRSRVLSTQAGDVELKIPKLRTGSFFPSLLERRRRLDRALSAVIMQAWVTVAERRYLSEASMAKLYAGPAPDTDAQEPPLAVTA